MKNSSSRRNMLLVVLLLSVAFVTTAQEVTAVPTAAPFVLTVWLPDEMAQPENATILPFFKSQAEAFAQNEGITVDLRVKKVNDVGGIMSTLKSASTVAPNALPTLTLLKRAELVSAQAQGLLQPLQGKISSAVLTELGDSVRLGQIDGTLYGVPYTLEVLQMVYRPQAKANYDSWNFANVLQRKEPFLFPAGRAVGLSQTFLLQYLASGATLALDGTLTFNEDALRQVLGFYENATDQKVVDGFAVNFNTPSDYATNFIRGDANQAVILSTSYLNLRQDNPDLRPAPIPTEDGRFSTTLDGWSWVIVTTDETETNSAIRFINTMMNKNNASAIAKALQVLPSQTSILADIIPDSADREFYTQLLANIIIPPADNENLVLEHALQDALVAVLTKEQSADQATALVSVQIQKK